MTHEAGCRSGCRAPSLMRRSCVSAVVRVALQICPAVFNYTACAKGLDLGQSATLVGAHARCVASLLMCA